MKDLLWDKAQIDHTSGCWLWTAARDSNGCGIVRIAGKLHKAHRAAYARVHGSIPAGYQVRQLCGNKACVSPHHLVAAPAGEALSMLLLLDVLQHRALEMFNLGASVVDLAKRMGYTQEATAEALRALAPRKHGLTQRTGACWRRKERSGR